MTFLLLIGTPPLLANSGVQLAKVFATGASGASHWQFGNVNRAVLVKLSLAGMAGGAAGAIVATRLPEDVLTPLVAVYLFFMGVRMIWRILNWEQHRHHDADPDVVALGAAGGFLNAIGGSGWGPVVTSTLLANGGDPRKTIGTVSLAEFFVSLTTAFVLVSHIHVANIEWRIVAGFIVGGMCAAPLGAHLVGKLPARTLVALVGVLIMGLSVSMLMSGLS
jgi:hypothetical protein